VPSFPRKQFSRSPTPRCATPHAAAPWIHPALLNVSRHCREPNHGAGSKFDSKIRQAAHIRAGPVGAGFSARRTNRPPKLCGDDDSIGHGRMAVPRLGRDRVVDPLFDLAFRPTAECQDESVLFQAIEAQARRTRFLYLQDSVDDQFTVVSFFRFSFFVVGSFADTDSPIALTGCLRERNLRRTPKPAASDLKRRDQESLI
jgi:hypothetical protein